MTVHINANGVPQLESGQWALILKNEGDAQPYMVAFGCPCGSCNDESTVVHNCYLQITVPGDNSPTIDNRPAWQWDGNWESPTLTPSIQRHGACNWHGYLRGGVFVEA